MNYTEIINSITSASLFDLWRLKCAIDVMLEDQTKNASIKRALRPGMEISYFEASENRLITAKVIDIRRTRVLVCNNTDGKHWQLPFYMLNMEGISTIDISTPHGTKKLSKINLKIGDQVGFNLHGEEVFGSIIRLNPKRAVVKLSNGKCWRVGYNALFSIFDGDSQHWEIAGNLLEGEIIN